MKPDFKIWEKFVSACYYLISGWEEYVTYGYFVIWRNLSKDDPRFFEMG